MSSAQDLNNSELVRRCLDGDDDAWRALMQRYKSLVYTMALRTGLDQEAAQEVFQLVWIELYRSLARIREPDALPGWLSIATRRLCYRHAMDRSRWVEGTFEEMVDPGEAPDAFVENLDLRRKLEETLDEVGEPCASLIRILFFHSPPLSYDEVARKTEMPRGTIGPLRSRCLTKLMKAMKATEVGS